MFEIGQRVVCVKPEEHDWGHDLPGRCIPMHLPKTGCVYTVREVIMGSDKLGGPHWTSAPGEIGLLLEEIRNEPTKTTNGWAEQAFHENDFMPLYEEPSSVERKVAEVA